MQHSSSKIQFAGSVGNSTESTLTDVLDYPESGKEDEH